MYKKPLVIFGLGRMAEIISYYFINEAQRDIAYFCIDEQYKDREIFNGIPVITQTDLLKKFSNKDIEFFIAIGYKKVNLIRKNKYLELKSLGFNFASFVSKNCNYNSQNKVGQNTFIFEDNTIQPFVSIGNNVILWSGNHIGHHAQINDHCFLTSQVVISGGCSIGEQTFIGVNSTIVDSLKIGERNIIGAGSLINTNTDPDSVYIAEAAKKSKVPSNRIKL